MKIIEIISIRRNKEGKQRLREFKRQLSLVSLTNTVNILGDLNIGRMRVFANSDAEENVKMTREVNWADVINIH